MARFVSIKFFSDSLDGSRFIQVGNHTCQLYYLMREDIPFIVKDPCAPLDTPALYVLLNREMRKAYVGQTDSFAKRIAQHLIKKEFWNEVLAFVASDNSINTTEVLFLEALAFEKAKEAKSYDLSENTQSPKAHRISPLTKEKTQEFFKTVCALTHLIGCDIFIPQNSSIKRVNAAKRSNAPIHNAIPESASLLKGTGIKIYLNGKGPYKKNRFVLEVIREYLKQNPSVTIDQVKETFPDNLLGNWKAWGLIEDRIEVANNLPSKRHFLRKDDILVSPGDNVRFVVSSQWDYHNIPAILSLVKRFGWVYVIQ